MQAWVSRHDAAWPTMARLSLQFYADDDFSMALLEEYKGNRQATIADFSSRQVLTLHSLLLS